MQGDIELGERFAIRGDSVIETTHGDHVMETKELGLLIMKFFKLNQHVRGKLESDVARAVREVEKFVSEPGSALETTPQRMHDESREGDDESGSGETSLCRRQGPCEKHDTEQRSAAASVAGIASNITRWGSTVETRAQRSVEIVKLRKDHTTARIAAKLKISVETVRKTLQKIREARP